MNRRTIKLYQRTYTLPVLAGGELDNLQRTIQSRSQDLRRGYRVVEKITEEKSGWFGKKQVRQQVRQPLTFEERYVELDNLVKNYDCIIETLTTHQEEYQQFFYGLTEEIQTIVTTRCAAVATLEAERRSLEDLARTNHDDNLLQVTASQKDQLLQTARTVGLAAILMLKKLELMSQSLEKIANDKETQRRVLAEMVQKLGLQRQAYELQLKINRLQAEAAEMAKVALNFEEYMAQFLGSFQTLLENVSQVDGEMAGAVKQIQEIANLMLNDQPQNLPQDDRSSEQVLDFLLAGQVSKDRLLDALERSREVNSEVAFDLEVEAIAPGEVSLEGCLENIQTYVSFQLAPALAEVEKKRQEEEKRRKTKQRKSLSIPIPGTNLTLELVQIPAGSFQMGDTQNSDEQPVHTVHLQAYRMSKYQVTQKLYQAVMGSNPAYFKGDDLPVERVSWDDAKAFCQKLSEKIGQEVRLPSEAEWEYACRAGSTGEYGFGNDPKQLGNCAWYAGNAGGQTHPVGQKQANDWGLYDMHGNVWEWCEDVWHDSYNGAPTDGSAWVAGGESNRRVQRGGSCFIHANVCRSAFRDGGSSDSRSSNYGFRVVLSSS